MFPILFASLERPLLPLSARSCRRAGPAGKRPNILPMSPSAGAGVPELVIIAVVALPSMLVPAAILYWVLSAGRRQALGTTDHSQRLKHDGSPYA